jgi:hypothetical protein
MLPDTIPNPLVGLLGHEPAERLQAPHHIIDQSPLEVLDLLSADLVNELRHLAEMIGHGK